MESWLPEEFGEPDIRERLKLVEDAQSYLLEEQEHKQMRQEFAKSKHEKYQKKRKRKPNFVMVHRMINQKAVRDNLFSSSEKQMLFDLIPFCNLESNVITDEEGIPMKQKDIVSLIGWNKAHVIEVMNGLIDKQVITKVERGKNVFYKISPEWYGGLR